jgi:hypothetical protein
MTDALKALVDDVNRRGRFDEATNLLGDISHHLDYALVSRLSIALK